MCLLFYNYIWALYNALFIPLTEILVMTKRNMWLITRHSSHHWISCLSRNMWHDDFSRLYWIPKLHNNPYRKDTCLDRLHFWNRTIITIIQEIQYFSIHIWLKLLREYTLFQYDCIPSLKTFQNITSNAVIFKIVRNVTN
jgi:hypothetical protein